MGIKRFHIHRYYAFKNGVWGIYIRCRKCGKELVVPHKGWYEK